MNTKVIALMCVILVAGCGTGYLVGTSVSKDHSSQSSDSGSGTSGENQILSDYDLTFGAVADHKTTFFITFDAGIGGYLQILDGNTVMNQYLIDAGKSTREVSVNTELSTLNHLSFKLIEHDFSKDFRYNVNYTWTTSRYDYGHYYSETARVEVTHNTLGNLKGKLVTDCGSPDITLSGSIYNSTYNKNHISKEKLITVQYIQVDFVKFYHDKEMRESPPIAVSS